MLLLLLAWTTATQFSPDRRSPRLTPYSVFWMQQLVSSQTLTSTTVACRVYFTTSCTGLTSRSESSTSLLFWFANVWRTKLRRTWATTAFRSPPSAADTYVSQPASADCTALLANYIRPSGFLCCGPDGLELTTDWVSGCFCRFWCFYAHSWNDNSAWSAVEKCGLCAWYCAI